MPTFPSRTELIDLLASAKMQGVSAEVIERLEWFAFFAEHKSVSKTCRHFGIARTTFYRWLRRFNPSDLQSLCDEETTPPQHLRHSYVLPEFPTEPSPIQRPSPSKLRPILEWCVVLTLFVNASFLFFSRNQQATPAPAPLEGNVLMESGSTLPGHVQMHCNKPHNDTNEWTCSFRLSQP